MTPHYKLEFVQEGSRVLSWNDLIIDAIDETEQKSFTITNNPSRTHTFVGDQDRLATEADIADVQEQLAQTATNPNWTIITGIGIFESQAAWEAWRAANMIPMVAPPAPVAPPPAPSSITPRKTKNHGYYPKRVIAKHQPGGVKNAPPPSTNIFSKPQFYSPVHTPQNYNIGAGSSQHVPITVQPTLKSFEGTVFGRMEVSE